jgi:hypothetical protein
MPWPRTLAQSATATVVTPRGAGTMGTSARASPSWRMIHRRRGTRCFARRRATRSAMGPEVPHRAEGAPPPGEGAISCGDHRPAGRSDQRPFRIRHSACSVRAMRTGARLGVPASVTRRRCVSSATEAWRPCAWRGGRAIGLAHAQQPLVARRHRGRDAGKTDLGFLEGLARVTSDTPAPRGISGCRDRRHLHLRALVIGPPCWGIQSRRRRPGHQLDLGPPERLS